jgi:hypothetical protein
MFVMQIAQLIALLTCKYEIFAHILFISQFTLQAKFQVQLSSTTHTHTPSYIDFASLLHYLQLLLVLCHLLTY